MILVLVLRGFVNDVILLYYYFRHKMKIKMNSKQYSNHTSIRRKFKATMRERVVLYIPGQHQPFVFKTISEAGEWGNDFGLLNELMDDVDAMVDEQTKLLKAPLKDQKPVVLSNEQRGVVNGALDRINILKSKWEEPKIPIFVRKWSRWMGHLIEKDVGVAAAASVMAEVIDVDEEYTTANEDHVDESV